MPGRNPVEGRHIALGVTGSIAAYKAAAIASALAQEGGLVDVLMTPQATQFVAPLTFEALTHRPVVTDMFRLSNSEISHVVVSHSADVLVVAPATAHTIAKLALGLADDPVSATALSTRAPGLLAPAMETGMWQNPATQAHIQTLRDRGWLVADPVSGHLASGATGEGRMAEPEQVVDIVHQMLGRSGDLAGRHIVVTAGGTREPIDPVRYLSNRSSGKMGHAIAEAARDRGAAVTLIATVALPPLAGMEVVAVERAEEMRDAVLHLLNRADVLVLAAAVADFRPAQLADQKLKRRDGVPELVLSTNVNVLEEAKAQRGAARKPFIVGFAAETENLLGNAREKFAKWGIDLVVANDVALEGSGFGSDLNKVTMLRIGGDMVDLPLLPKIEVAHRLLDEVIALGSKV
ncbi:MAG: bifunctional phosphopantothenoylcysteine decarboxylase/phosphopantothenate--cysteine ligase CoaBC [Chloroflexi bacterium]|nr:bifunctional phosphopantothenoylcysteine decarboxylase/phosphopantothenate--cysteine ligase CoaBC [Chloroflexota bacterium]